MEVVEIIIRQKRRSKIGLLVENLCFTQYVGVVKEVEHPKKKREAKNKSGIVTNRNMGVKHGTLKKSF